MEELLLHLSKERVSLWGKVYAIKLEETQSIIDAERCADNAVVTFDKRFTT